MRLHMQKIVARRRRWFFVYIIIVVFASSSSFLFVSLLSVSVIHFICKWIVHLPSRFSCWYCLFFSLYEKSINSRRVCLPLRISWYESQCTQVYGKQLNFLFRSITFIIIWLDSWFEMQKKSEKLKFKACMYLFSEMKFVYFSSFCKIQFMFRCLRNVLTQTSTDILSWNAFKTNT